MTKLSLAPCPFCGCPNHTVSPRHAGPVRAVRRWNRHLKKYTTRPRHGAPWQT